MSKCSKDLPPKMSLNFSGLTFKLQLDEEVSIYNTKDSLLKDFLELEDKANYTFLSKDISISSGGAKEFLFMKTELVEKFINSYEPERRVFYEVEVFNENIKQRRKLKFDFDLKSDSPLFEKAQDETKFIIIDLVQKIKKTFKECWNIDLVEKNIICFDSSTSRKISYHVVIDGYSVSNNLQAKEFMLKVRESEWEWAKSIDTAPYSTWQNFRIKGCRKIGGTNVKKTGKFSDKTSPNFLSCLTTYVEGCHELEDIIIRDNALKKYTKTVISDEQSDTVIELFNSIGSNSNEWELRNIKSGIFAMKQLEPSFCQLCQREHDGASDNCSLYLTLNDEGDVYQHCRRFEDEGNIRTGIRIFNIETGEIGEKSIPRLLTKREPTEKTDIQIQRNPDTKAKEIQERIDELMALDATAINIPDKWVRPIKDEEKVVGIIANCGKGKTAQAIDDIEKNSDQSILVVSPRISFTNSVSERIKREIGVEFTHYSKVKGIISNQHVICQVESLYRLGKQYDRIYIDEIESCLTQLISKGTNGVKFSENNQVFQEQLIGARKIVFMDAFMSKRTTNYMTQLGIPFDIQNYTDPPVPGRAFRFPFEQVRKSKTEPDKDDGLGRFTQFLADQISDGKKFYFPCESVKKQSAIISAIQEKCPGVKIKCYNTNEKLSKEENVNVEWIKYDIVSTTSTITVGVNFDVPDYFDFVAVYLSTMSHVVARDTFQSSYRVRKTKENTIYWIHNTWRMKQALANWKILEDKFTIRENCHHESIGRVLGTDESVLKMEDPVRSLYIWDSFERAMNLMNKEEVWKRYLNLGNFKIEDMPINDDEDVIILECQTEANWDYDELEELYPSEKADLLIKKRTEGITEEERMRIVKYDYQNLMMKKHRATWKDHWPDFLKNKKLFFNLSIERGFDPNDKMHLALMDAKEFAEFSGLRLCRSEKLSWLLEKLKLNNSRDMETIVERIDIEGIMDQLKSERTIIDALFGLRTSREKGVKTEFVLGLNCINSILEECGGTKLKAKQSRGKTFQLVDKAKLGDDLFEKIKPSVKEAGHLRLLPRKVIA